MDSLLTAPLVVFDYFANAMTLLGWVLNNAIWHVMASTGIAAVPFIALIAAEWFRARQEGDEAGSKGILTVNRIETRLYAMLLAYAFTCLPLLQVQLATAEIDEQRSRECGTRQFAAGGWAEGAFGATENAIGGQQPRIPLWWAGVHAVSRGLTGAAVGGTLAILPFQAGMDMLKQSLPMIQGILAMAIVICLPFVMVISSYSFKVAGLATFGLFATWFLTFWWELARWINANLVDLLYGSEAAKMSWLAAANNLYDRMVLQFVEGMLFLVLPGVWVGILGWAGIRVGSAISDGMGSGRQAQGVGQKGGQAAQSKASGGKL